MGSVRLIPPTLPLTMSTHLPPSVADPALAQIEYGYARRQFLELSTANVDSKALALAWAERFRGLWVRLLLSFLIPFCSYAL